MILRKIGEDVERQKEDNYKKGGITMIKRFVIDIWINAVKYGKRLCIPRERVLYLMIRKYKVEGKVEIHEFQEGSKLTVILYRLIKEDESHDLTLPDGFIKDFKEKIAPFVAKKMKKLFGKHAKVILKISSKGITTKEIEEKIKSWNEHCQLFWAAID